MLYRKRKPLSYSITPPKRIRTMGHVCYPNKWSKMAITGVKMASTLILYRICMICIWIDCKFSSEFNYFHLEVIRGHITGSKKVIWGRKSEKCRNTAKCTWYAYHSTGNFPLNSMICILRSFEVILRGQKRSFGVENRKYGQMHKICISFDWRFYSEFNYLHFEVSRGHLRD